MLGPAQTVISTVADDVSSANVDRQALHEAIVNTTTDAMGKSQPVEATSGPLTLTGQPTTLADNKITSGDVPGLVQQSKLETWRENNENEFSEAYDAGVGQSTMAHAPAIGRPERFRGSRNGTVRPPISQKPRISAKRALGEMKSLQDRAGVPRGPHYSRGVTAILLDQGVKATRIPTKAALAVLLIAQCMTSGCLYFRVVLMA